MEYVEATHSTESIGVRRVADGTIIVIWTCGESRTFEENVLKGYIEMIDRIAWDDGRGTFPITSEGIEVMLHDDVLTVYEYGSELGGFNWEQFKAAVEKVIATEGGVPS